MRLISGVALIVLSATSPSLARERSGTVESITQSQTFAIKLPETHRATGLRARMVKLAVEQMEQKGYRLAARGQAADLIVKLRFEDSWFTMQPFMLEEISPPPRWTYSSASSFSTASGEAFPYPATDARIGAGLVGHGKPVGRRRMERVAPHRLYVGFSVATAADNQLLHVQELARETEYAKVEQVGRDMIGQAVAGVPAARL